MIKNNCITENLLNLDETIAKNIFNECLFPWEVLPKIQDYILELGNNLDLNIYNKIGENIWIAKSAIVSPTASITGPAIIGENTEIRHCAFIRGNAIVGNNCVIGNSVELKNVIIFNNVEVPHFNYVGDSILGFHSHMGAGVITSNLKSDRKLINVHDGAETINTGLEKFGAIIGDYVEIGCNSVLNPGCVIGRSTSIYPLSSVRGVIKPNSIYKNKNDIVDKI